jgi:glycosyltransferase involved in cell wall biosynthesis
LKFLEQNTLEHKANNSKVSVIIPCFNQGRFLNDTLKSVFFQSYENWECIIINDGSTDNTEKIAYKWVNADSRFKYFYKTNGGLSSARNAGLEKVEGTYLLFLDSDDCIHRDKISNSLRLLNSRKLDMVISDFRRFKKNITKLKPAFCTLSEQNFSLESILLDWDTKYTIPIHCCLFSSHLFKDLQFNETLKAKEDWMMWIMVFKQNPKVEYLNEPLAFYRKNPKSMTKNWKFMSENNVLAYKEILAILEDKHKALFISKIINDGDKSKDSYFKKYTKYKKLSFNLFLIICLLAIFTIVLWLK